MKLEPMKATPYLSVVEGRKPRQKVHTHLSHAKNAFDTPKVNDNVPDYFGRRGAPTHGWGAIFEHKDGEWVQVFEIPKPTEADRNDEGKYYGDLYETRPWKKNA